MTDVSGVEWPVRRWEREIESWLAGSSGAEPYVNIRSEDPRIFDAIFVGGGAAGRFGAAYLKAMGGRALIVDRWPFLGGSCPHHACVPHHLFSDIAAQLLLERTFSGRLWFQRLGRQWVSMRDIVAMFREGRIGPHAFMNYQSKEQLDLEFILGAPARLIDAHRVEVAGHGYQTRNLVIASGARARPPPAWAEGLAGVYDHASLVDTLETEPGPVAAVIGGGKTAIEYGCFFNATGRRTVIVSRDPPLGMLPDGETRAFVIARMREQGIEFWSNTEWIGAEGDDKGRVRAVTVRSAHGEIRLATDFVFRAQGMIPNSETAQAALGVSLREDGAIEVDERLRTSVADVYAVGDVTGAPMEMFKARKGGMYAARNIMGEVAHYRVEDHPDFLHTHYEVCWLGLGEEQARARYRNVVVLKLPPDNPDGIRVALPAGDRMMLYAMMRPELTGFQKLVVDGDSRRILGAFHVGYGAKDGFQYLAPLVRRGLTVDEMGEMDELFLNPSYFIQLCRLRAGSRELRGM